MKILTLQYAKKSNKKIYFESLLNAFLISLCLIVVSVFAFFATHSLLQISGHSMEPGIANSGQSCFVKNNSSFTYGDIIVVHKNQKTDVIKRVIAMEGDKVGFYNLNPKEQNLDNKKYKVVLIKSGQTEPTFLNETYLSSIDVNTTSYNKFVHLNNLENVNINEQTVKMLSIKENQVFYLGDNRAVSEDCSSYGAVAVSQVQGKVDQIFWSTTPPILIAIKAVFGF